nr:winged helix DNA-binding domain-containing protein [Propionicimonas sp.]
MDRDAVLAARLANQRLNGPAASGPVQVVGELLCVQAQDAPLARAMIALRCAGRVADVDGAVARGELVRTHVLRPTWHYVAAGDLRWLLALTSAKVESGMAARHRQLGLTGPRLDSALDVLVSRLTGRRFATRTEVGDALAGAGVLDRPDPLFGQQVGHVLLVGELRALVCSAPVEGVEHRYALVAEVLPASDPLSRDTALTELVGRFVAGHGPVAVGDLTRWARVTRGEARTALDRLGDRVARVVVDGEELWHVPDAALPATRPQPAWLLSVFDEAFLSYRGVPWPASGGNLLSSHPRRFAESSGGVVLHGLRDVGGWKRRRSDGGRIELDLDPGLPRAARQDVTAAVERLRAVFETSVPASTLGADLGGVR